MEDEEMRGGDGKRKQGSSIPKIHNGNGEIVEVGRQSEENEAQQFHEREKETRIREKG